MKQPIKLGVSPKVSAPVAPKQVEGVTATTELAYGSEDLVLITHTQEWTQSIDYQSGKVAYGVTIQLRPKQGALKVTDDDIRRGQERATELVEGQMSVKLPEAQELLRQLARENHRSK